MTLVDSSVWISFLRDEQTAETTKLVTAKNEGEVLLGDLVLLEVLQGARDESHAQRLEMELRAFPLVELLDSRTAIAAARNYRRLRRQGFTVRKTPDLIIGTFCLEKGHTLLHDDRDFDAMEKLLGLAVA